MDLSMYQINALLKAIQKRVGDDRTILFTGIRVAHHAEKASQFREFIGSINGR